MVQGIVKEINFDNNLLEWKTTGIVGLGKDTFELIWTDSNRGQKYSGGNELSNLGMGISYVVIVVLKISNYRIELNDLVVLQKL